MSMIRDNGQPAWLFKTEQCRRSPKKFNQNILYPSWPGERTEKGSSGMALRCVFLLSRANYGNLSLRRRLKKSWGSQVIDGGLLPRISFNFPFFLDTRSICPIGPI